ncbi:MAG: hypothetical protein HY547_02920 [Elusimicrobia bacterium]|nr:hypothetical protein [Elusimicrobiota bacterium]
MSPARKWPANNIAAVSFGGGVGLRHGVAQSRKPAKKLAGAPKAVFRAPACYRRGPID